MVFVMDKPWLAQKSNNRTPLRVQIGEAVPPDHAPPGITVVTHAQTTARDLSPTRRRREATLSFTGVNSNTWQAELGSYKQAHTSSPPLTLGNSRVVEGPAPLKELGSRAQAMRGGIGSSRPPATTATQTTLHRPLMDLPAGGEPTGRQAHVARPPGTRLRAPTPGLAPGWGPGATPIRATGEQERLKEVGVWEDPPGKGTGYL
ncbi:hypothetical protein L3Q82_006435 [Scortum barcoo]|uniref:Uncharacterized protein n=1 Tax=Scortum barcoo TaxID=214431 RepID=A0ACB8X2C3_9TELE|nr:hypothetical protein L3Q82_006435 [Scortum barcoo]